MNKLEYIDIDIIKLRKLYFTEREIDLLGKVISRDGKAVVSKMVSNGIDYDTASKIKYAYDISIGRITIDMDTYNSDDLSKHLRKMSGGKSKLSVADLEVSTITKVPRYLLIGGIKDEVYSKLNSKNYPGTKGIYKAVKVTKTKVYIKVDDEHKPVVPYKYSEKVKGTIDLVEKTKDGLILSIDRKYCKLLNRYAVMASLRMPERYIDMCRILAKDGTKIYVYAQDIGIREKVYYSSMNSRVYDFGYIPKEVYVLVKKHAKSICNKLQGVAINSLGGNYDFEPIYNDASEDEYTE